MSRTPTPQTDPAVASATPATLRDRLTTTLLIATAMCGGLSMILTLGTAIVQARG